LRPVARYELLIDGKGRWKARSEEDVRTWLDEYCEEHAADDPDAAHVQIRRLSPWAWLTGGRLVDRKTFLLVVGVALAFAAPAQAALKPGDTAAIAVSVATLWKAPNVYRSIDRPAVTNPVDLDAWNRNLATGDLRRALVSRVQTQALYGEVVTVLRVSGRWAKVAVRDQPDPQDPHGYPGWVPRVQLRTGYSPVGPGLSVRERRAVVSLNSGGRVPVSYGTWLPVERETLDGDAYVVRTPNGYGTIAKSALAPAPHLSGASVVQQAKRFLGLRYLWGGLSAWGFDCSGLVWDVFRFHGRMIPRDADPQFRSGTPVARGELRPGDLVFYGTQRYVHHVAIYAGNGRMLEAPNSDSMVRLVPFRTTEYAGARRYVDG
jgi:gamma-D-glutamyl-L-lysine dipeptidyl-peptidase